MSLSALTQNIWAQNASLLSSVPEPVPQSLSPYFFILGKNTSLENLFHSNHHLFLEAGSRPALEQSLSFITASAPDFALCMTSRSACYSGMAQATARVLCERFGMPRRRSMDIETCLQEAVTNAIVHGNLGIESRFSTAQDMDAFYAGIQSRLETYVYASKRVTVTASQYSDHITIGVSDQGEGFSLADSIKTFDPKKPHGRGMILMQSMADKVWVEKESSSVYMRFAS